MDVCVGHVSPFFAAGNSILWSFVAVWRSSRFSSSPGFNSVLWSFVAVWRSSRVFCQYRVQQLFVDLRGCMEVFQVFYQYRVQQRFKELRGSSRFSTSTGNNSVLWSFVAVWRSSRFSYRYRVHQRFVELRGCMEVFQVFYRYRVQQRFVELPGCMEVFQVFYQYREQQRCVEVRGCMEVFQVFYQYRVQQRFVELRGCMEVFQVFYQYRVQQRFVELRGCMEVFQVFYQYRFNSVLWSFVAVWRSSRFSTSTGFNSVLWSFVAVWRSSRFSTSTGFNSVLWRFLAVWRSSRFSTSTGFNYVFWSSVAVGVDAGSSIPGVQPHVNKFSGSSLQRLWDVDTHTLERTRLKATTTTRLGQPMVVATLTAVHPHGPGNGDAPLVRQGAHRERRANGPDDCQQGRGGRGEVQRAPATETPSSPRCSSSCTMRRAPCECSRLASLGEPPGPQDRVQRRTVGQIIDFAPMVQILAVPVPHVVDNWWTSSRSRRKLSRTTRSRNRSAQDLCPRSASSSRCSFCCADG